MNKKIVIMESPTKAKAVQKYLGSEYLVVSSGGHISNLANKGEYRLGIDLVTFMPYYRIETKKKSLVAELKVLVKDADKVFLVTDPDREGESIAYHLNEFLRVQNKSQRVSFNEITKNIVLAAFKEPREIDMNLVHSQEARRMIDRMIGFRLSKLLQKKIHSKSAGRVQSVALKILAIREKEHQEFIPEEYWTIEAHWKKYILKLTKYQNKDLEIITSSAKAQNIVNNLNNKFQVIAIQEKPRARNPHSAYTTSTMLQDASRILNFAANRTSLLAQQLYEGISVNGSLIGFITYPRTDSTRLANNFIQDTFDFIKKTVGEKYLGTVKPMKKKNSVQDAHEGIRPTDVNMTPEQAKEFLGRDQLRLYKLIYNRAVASLMAPAQILGKTIILNNNDYEFRISGQAIKFLGFLKYYQDDDAEQIIKLPNWKIDEIVNINEIKSIQHWTKPKPRYSEARLIKTLEELGVGRPSTYAPIMRTLRDRGYVTMEHKALKASEKGILTNDKLQEFFYDIINEAYTSKIEDKLDLISQGKKDYRKVVGSFWNKFEPRVVKAFKEMIEVAIEKTGTLCPLCNHDLVYRFGKYGKFIGCSNFPKCRYLSSLNPVNLGSCPKCIEGEKVIKINRRQQKFIACSNYPECDFVEALTKENIEE